MVNVGASQQDMKKSRESYLRHILVYASHSHTDQDRNYIGMKKKITFLLTNLGQHELYCKCVKFNLLEGNRVSKALQNWLAPKPKLASKLAKNFNYGVCNCDT